MILPMFGSARPVALAMAVVLVSACGSGSHDPALVNAGGTDSEAGVETGPGPIAADDGSGEEEQGEPGISDPCDDHADGASLELDFLCPHNRVRTTLNGRLDARLPLLEWDEQLADIARAHAEECQYEHNPTRSAGYPGSVGENLFASSGDSSPRDAVEAWAAEARYYDELTHTCVPGEDCGHYTQLVWRETLRVGCGQAACAELAVDGQPWFQAVLSVCNYSPAGNIVGRDPF